MNGPDFKSSKLIPAIAQDATSGRVLMLAYMNEQAYQETLATRRGCYYSRSRKTLWRKGETSGNIQRVEQVFYDCDADAILLKVEQVGGAACHEGYESCFFKRVEVDSGVTHIEEDRVFDPVEKYGKETERS